jgi:hypothetical protein
MLHALEELWLDFLYWSGIRDRYDWCTSCRREPKAFDDDFGSPHGVCGGCGADAAEAGAEAREDR